MKGSDFVAKLKSEFNCETESELADVLGRSVQNIYGWKRSKNISPMVAARAMRELAKRAEGDTKALREQLREKQVAHSISALIEYAPIAPLHKSGSKMPQIKSADGYGHLKLRDRIEGKKGIYIFYSSLCRSIYVGKSNETEFWTECNSAYNRSYKGDFCRVNHPSENQKTPKNIKLLKHQVQLFEVASYLSVYEVDNALVDTVEALMIRSFINELGNVKIENLAEIRQADV